MATSPIQAFRLAPQRAETLFNLHSDGVGRPKKEKEDLLRAAVILAIAGVDSYVHDKILERLTPFLRKQKGKNLPGGLLALLKEQGGVEKLMQLLYEERPHRHSHTMVKKAQADRTFQKPKKIEDALRTIGIRDFWYKVARKIGRGMSKERLQSSLSMYATRRDKIAHEGDRATGGKLNAITRGYVKKCLVFVNRFVEAADRVIDAATS